MVASLYIHVPFCIRKCDYCHFFVLPNKPKFHALYLEGIREEIQRISPLIQNIEIESIYFGGGTPYLLGADAIHEILSQLKLPKKQIEITLEANPGEVTPQEMLQFAKSGINRVSLGVQALDDPTLKFLTRQHTKKEVYEAIDAILQAGIHNLSIDLMYELPHQTLQMWENTLKEALSLPITHLSAYNLTIEKNTPFYKRKKEIDKALPGDLVGSQMYQLMQAMSAAKDLQQYEISAFAKNSYRSHHNLGYWLGRPFLGLGPSAFSYWEGARFRNIANLSRYVERLKAGKSPIDFREKLEQTESVKELLGVGLRVLEGVNLDNFVLSEQDKINIQSLEQKGFALKKNNHLRLTQKGILFYDTAQEILLY